MGRRPRAPNTVERNRRTIMSIARFFKDFAVLGLGTAANMLIGLITTPIITRLVAPDAYGEYSMFIVYGTTVLAFTSLGLDQSLLRYFYDREDVMYRSELLAKCVRMSLVVLVCLAVAIIVYLISSFVLLGIMDELTPLILFSLYSFVLLLNRYSSVLIRLMHDSALYSRSLIANKLIFASIAIPLLLWLQGDFSFDVLAVSLIASTTIITILQISSYKDIWRIDSLRFNCSPSKSELLKYGLPFVFSSAASVLLSAVGRITLDLFGNNVEVGIFAAAINLTAIFSIVQGTFNILWAPVAVEHNSIDPDDHRPYISANHGIGFLLFSFGFIVIAFKDVLVLLLGAEYREASFLLPLLCFNPIFHTLSETTVTGIILKKKSSYHIWVSLLALVSNFVICCLAVPAFGTRGAALGAAVGYIVFYASRSAFSHKVMPIAYGQYRVVFSTILLLIFAIWNTFSVFVPAMILYLLLCYIVLCYLYRDVLHFILQTIGRRKLN